MSNINLNAVFYSGGNIELAYNIKKALWENNIYIDNVSDFFELVYAIHEEDINILFIDCDTIELNQQVVDLTLGIKLGAPDNVIFIGDNKNIDLHINNQNRFLFDRNNIQSQISNIESKIRFNVKCCKGHKYNISKVNSYLSQYLMSIGFYPKHNGFVYIKNSIEEALNNNGLLGSLSSNVYPIVASRNKTNIQNVERSIRNAIECAFKNSHGEQRELLDLFKNKRVSNRTFLSFLLDHIIDSHDQIEQTNLL